jgi:hypothetical protein
MAKQSSKGAVITINSQAFSTYCRSYEIQWGQDVPDVTGFSDGWKNYLGGCMPAIGFTLDMMWEATASTGVFPILKAMMATAAPCSIVPESGAPSFSGTFICDGFNPQAQASGGVINMGSVHFSASGTSIATFTS